MAHKDSPSLDHIDPLWEEGRDYQLVCGRDCERNWRDLTVDGFRANAGNVARHNIANGWDPANKRRIA